MTAIMSNLKKYDDGSNSLSHNDMKESKAKSSTIDLHTFSKKLVWYRRTLIGIGTILTSVVGYAIYKIMKMKRGACEKA